VNILSPSGDPDGLVAGAVHLPLISAAPADKGRINAAKKTTNVPIINFVFILLSPF
jgi:hypothetical protein